MSRAYRIAVSETLRRHVQVEDGVQTKLELLQVLPADRMGALLAAELKKLGFEEGEPPETLQRQDDDGIEVTIDKKSGSVTVRLRADKQLELHDQRVLVTNGDPDDAQKELRKRSLTTLERQADHETETLRQQVTAKLERKLRDLHAELDGAVGRVTREALKEKASQMGEIEELSEDEQTGAMTIRVRL